MKHLRVLTAGMTNTKYLLVSENKQTTKKPTTPKQRPPQQKQTKKP